VAEETITLKLIATDLASGNISKAIGSLDKMAQRGGLLGSVMQGVGIQFGMMLNPVALVARGIGMVTDVMGDAVRAAMEEEAGIAQLTRSIEENSEGWDGNIDRVEEVISAREKLAFSDGEQRDSLRQLVAVTKDVDKALALQAQAMDLARLRGMSLVDAGTLVGKVYAGNVGILSRYGIQLAKGTTATEALAEIQRRAQGQAEAYANTTQGKLVRAQIALENAMERLGMTLTPVVGQMAELAAEHIPNIVEGIGELVQEIGRFDPAFERVLNVNDAFDALEERLGLTNGELDKSRAKWTALARESDLVTGTVEELTEAFWGENKAMLWTIGHQRELAALTGRTGKASGDAADDATELDAALTSLAEGGLKEVRKEAQQTAKAVRRLLGEDDPPTLKNIRSQIEELERLRDKASLAGRTSASSGSRSRRTISSMPARRPATTRRHYVRRPSPISGLR
jgi:hypothetical protein